MKKMRKGKGHNIYLDDESWELLDTLVEVGPGTSSRSSLIREGITLLKDKYEFLVESALKKRQDEKKRKKQEELKKILKIQKNKTNK